MDGKATSSEIFDDLSARVGALAERGVRPGLGTVLVGDDPGSRADVRGKHADCAKIGITSIRRDLPATASAAQVAEAIDELNADPACTGYLVQLPLPVHIDSVAMLERVDPAKDADGLHPTNLGRLVLGVPGLLRCTPRGIVEPLRRFGVAIAGDVQPGAAVLDVGITRTEQGLVGDVAPEVREVAGFVAPMPGGVGAMTRAMLLTNVVEATECAAGLVPAHTA